MFPVFSLVLDKDVKSEVAMLYPELYKDLLKVWEILVCFGLSQDSCLDLKLSKCVKSHILSVDRELYHAFSSKIVLKANLN